MKIYQLIIITLGALSAFGCGAVGNQTASPTETVKIFVEASKVKNTATVKSTLSKGTLEMMEKNAQKQNTTVDELLSRDIGAPAKEVPEMRNEQIEGETATVEIKLGAGDRFDKIPFVREEGVWKIALDQYLQEAMNQMNQDMQTAPSSDNPKADINPAANTNSKTDANSK